MRPQPPLPPTTVTNASSSPSQPPMRSACIPPVTVTITSSQNPPPSPSAHTRIQPNTNGGRNHIKRTPIEVIYESMESSHLDLQFLPVVDTENRYHRRRKTQQWPENSFSSCCLLGSKNPTSKPQIRKPTVGYDRPCPMTLQSKFENDPTVKSS